MYVPKPDSEHPVKSFGPMEAHPAAVQEVLGLARRAEMVPESWVADGRASAGLVPYFDQSAEGVADVIARQVEDAQQDFRRDVPTIVLHVGDRDDHGDDIYMAAAWGCSRVGRGSRLRPPLHLPTTPRSLALLTRTIVRMEKNDSSGPGLIFMRLALTPAQAQEHGLLDADGKAEVDAVPVPVMDAWLTEAIEALQVPARRDSLKVEEERERERLPQVIRERLAAA